MEDTFHAYFRHVVVQRSLPRYRGFVGMSEECVAEIFRRQAIGSGRLLRKEARARGTRDDVVLGLFPRGGMAGLHVVSSMLHLHEQANHVGQGNGDTVNGYAGIGVRPFKLVL